MGVLVEIPERLPFVRRPPGLPNTCTDADLCEAVKAYLCGADDAVTAELLHVPAHAVKHWTDSREWGALCLTLKGEVEGVIGGQMTRLASLAFVQLEQRLTRGDPMVGPQGALVRDEEGNLVYRPIKAKELSHIATQMLETKAKLEGKIATDHDDPDTISLRDLARSLKRYAEAKEIEGEKA